MYKRQANALLDEQHTVLIRNVAQLLQELSNYKTNTQQYLRQLCSYELLILDELTMVRQNTAQQELLYQVIEACSKVDVYKRQGLCATTAQVAAVGQFA